MLYKIKGMPAILCLSSLAHYKSILTLLFLALGPEELTSIDSSPQTLSLLVSSWVCQTIAQQETEVQGFIPS